MLGPTRSLCWSPYRPAPVQVCMMCTGCAGSALNATLDLPGWVPRQNQNLVLELAVQANWPGVASAWPGPRALRSGIEPFAQIGARDMLFLAVLLRSPESFAL